MHEGVRDDLHVALSHKPALLRSRANSPDKPTQESAYPAKDPIDTDAVGRDESTQDLEDTKTHEEKVFKGTIPTNLMGDIIKMELRVRGFKDRMELLTVSKRLHR
ncbi:hypothetical protein AAF712_015954 [Marasmius tenuissimus]|uniref:Uncharacterized protein n=1 Tax=Marasmius tenuissimus TaxID=585030 RepID=A0ABR2Z924_9AGAR